MADEPPPAPVTHGTPSRNRTVMIILSYLGVLVVVPLLIERDDEDVQWHAKHGLVLTAVDLVIVAVLWLMQVFLGALGWIAAGGVLFVAIPLMIVAVHAIAIFKGLNGNRLMIPRLSMYADRL